LHGDGVFSKAIIDSTLKPNASPETKQYFLGKQVKNSKKTSWDYVQDPKGPSARVEIGKFTAGRKL